MFKQYITLGLCILFSVHSFSQNKSFEFKDRIICNLFHANLMQSGNDLKLKWYSRGIGAHYYYSLPVYKQKVQFAVGVGVSNYNFYSNSYVQNIQHPDSSIFPEEEYTQFKSYSSDTKPKRNKLTLTYAELPFELRFNGKPNEKGHQFKFAVGGRLGYMLDIHTKTILSAGKYKNYIFPNVEKINYGVHIRFGYYRTHFFAQYYLNPVFKKNLGDEITPFSVGFSYTLY